MQRSSKGSRGGRRSKIREFPEVHLAVRCVDLPERVGIGLCDECALKPAQATFALGWGWPDYEEPDPDNFYCSEQCLGLAKLALLARKQAD